MKTPVFTPVIASASEAIHSPKERMDCFVACAPRNDERQRRSIGVPIKKKARTKRASE